MKILVVGSGGREHALVWKIHQSHRVKKIYCAPGNTGTASLGENVPISATNTHELKKFAVKEKIDLTVVGPELPLINGIVDEFLGAGLRIFGPYKISAELEGSKVFAKQFMERHKIPTSKFQIADSPKQAKKIINSGIFSLPMVVKADGLAAGKGVIICRSRRKAEEAVETLMVEKKFGEAGKLVLIEEFLVGKEASFIALSDGAKINPFATTMDHKAVFDGDKGPNTGGMGAISPNPFVDRETFEIIVKKIALPTVMRMLEEGRKFKGVLYIGLMLTREGPKVLEYNCRFGDPETQPQMLRLKSDLVDIMEATIDDSVLDVEVEWSRNASGCVVIASGGYPTKFEKGKLVQGLKEISDLKDIEVFHAGLEEKDGKHYTSGGRVLNVCAAEDTLSSAMSKIYDAISKIYFEAIHYRRDIGALREGE